MSFLKKFYSPFILLLSILLFFYIYYKSEIINGGDNRSYYVKYIILIIIITFYSIISFFVSEKIKEYLIISSVVIVACFYTFEIYLTYSLRLNKSSSLNKQVIKIYEKKTGKIYDTRTIEEIYSDLKKVNDNVVLKVPPISYLNNKDLDLFPFSGVSNSKTIYQNENGYYMIYDSDRFGFNNPDFEWDNKEVDSILIGDSFTHGASVNRPNDIASVLRNISGKSILNLGYSANGPLIEYGAINEYLFQNNDLIAKNIIWLFTDNDIQGLVYELESDLLKKYLQSKKFSQKLILKQNKIDQIAKKEIIKTKYETKKFYFFRLLKLYELRNTIVFKQKYKDASIPNEFTEILSNMKKLSQENNSNFYFVYIPDPMMYFGRNFNYELRDQVIKIVKDLNINLIDVHLELSKNSENIKRLYPFQLLGHYNVTGYKEVSKIIFNGINQ